MKLINLKNDDVYKEVSLSELELSEILYRNWDKIFCEIKLIKKEFFLSGSVRKLNKSGRIDFLAFNVKTSSLVVIEVKKDYDRNIRSQIFDYADFIEENFEFVYLKANEFYHLPNLKTLKNKKVELILFAKSYKPIDYSSIMKIDYPITLLTYRYFSNNSILLSSRNNIKKIEKKEIPKIQIDKITNEFILSNFWNGFKSLVENKILKENLDYKINYNILTIRIDKVFSKINSFNLFENTLESRITLNIVRKSLKESDEYICNKSHRFNIVTAGYEFDLTKLKGKNFYN